MSGQIGIAMTEVLSLLGGLKLLAGESGLRRIVRSVGVMETTDLFPLVKHGDLILSGLFALKDDPAALTSLVSELDRRGAAGLVIKRRYVTELPAEMLALAERLAFPLLEMPADLSFSDVMQPVFGQLLGRQGEILARQLQVQQVAMQAALEGRGLSRMAEALAHLVGNPVAIRDAAGRALAVAGGPGMDGPQLERLLRKEWSPGEFRISGRDTLHRTESLQDGGRRLTRVVTAIASGEQRLGEIIVCETGRPLDQADLVTISSVGLLSAFELVSRRSSEQADRRYRRELLSAFFAPERRPEEEARLFGWEAGTSYYAIVAAVEGQARAALLDAIERSGLAPLIGQTEGHIILLMPGEDSGGGRRAAKALLALAEPFRRALRITVGVGRAYEGVPGLRRTFDEACRAASVGEQVWGAGAVYHIDDLGIFQLLSRLQPDEETERFLTAVDQLLAYEKESRIDLVQTLETYFACKGNVRKVSERLFTHYNTVLYRLERIQQITGVQLEDPAGRLHLQVALQMARLFGRLPAPAGGERHVIGGERGV